ncbi:hypothetical protein I79_006625 [Cricetulus griseus]|uniref:Uncharacterized protein n=1 Tax=Cricetulus griseus TaxID=10029 RepID=G3H8C5_CRIGR|nr:hypothetical protein I79_006625 [Cricetulus griseus]
MVRVQPAHGLVSRCLWLGFFGLPVLVPAVFGGDGTLPPKSSVPGMSPPRPPALGSERHNRTKAGPFGALAASLPAALGLELPADGPASSWPCPLQALPLTASSLPGFDFSCASHRPRLKEMEFRFGPLW